MGMSWMNRLESMADEVLLSSLAQIVGRSRDVEAEVVAHIAEVDARRLYLGQGCSSMFGYCTEVLHLSEAEAYLRIAVARASRQHEALLPMLADGRLHLSAIAALAPHLTEANRERVLGRAVHKSKRQIQELIAELAPRPDVKSAIRKLPARATPASMPTSTSTSTSTPAPTPTPRPAPTPTHAPARVEPLAPDRYKVQFTADAALEAKLARLKAEMRHQVPDGDLATLIDIAVTEKLAQIEKRRYARTESPRSSVADADPTPRSRYIPAAIRRAVRERDGDQCTFVGDAGRRCTERGGLEVHHEEPYGKGGGHGVEGLRLLCRAHNQHLAERDYGTAHMAAFRSPASERRAIYDPGGAPASGRALAQGAGVHDAVWVEGAPQGDEVGLHLRVGGAEEEGAGVAGGGLGGFA
jgi:5-methylcytosine-specific restriction endonuclease McrA